MSYRIDKVGIVGAGTMGGGIAAHLANIGIPVVLLDIVPPNLSEAEQSNPAARNRIVTSLYDRMAKARPANLARADRGDLITLGNLEDDFDKLADCDPNKFIIERTGGGRAGVGVRSGRTPSGRRRRNPCRSRSSDGREAVGLGSGSAPDLDG